MSRELKCRSVVYNIRIVVCLSLPLIFSYQLKCDHRTNCGVLQTDSLVDCCYLSAGDQCGDDTKGICDPDMGYSCDAGICSGKKVKY